MDEQKQPPMLTLEEVEKSAQERVSAIDKELKAGFKFIKREPKSVSFFGSARFREDNVHYKQADRIASRLSKLGYTIVTGGGPGIMEGANRGAYNAGGPSVGLNIMLPMEQSTNPYLTESMEFYYFFTRKIMLSFAAEAYIFFPGGFGTLDEFFEILTLVQTKKIPSVPIIAVGRDYWEPLNQFIYSQMYEKHAAIDKADMNLYTTTDDEDEIVELVKKAPVKNGIKFHHENHGK